MIDLFFLVRGLLQREERGQTMAEYAVVLAVITIAVVAALYLLSGNVGTAISRVSSKV
jgi:Flp pilus assembly pilin Flp